MIIIIIINIIMIIIITITTIIDRYYHYYYYYYYYNIKMNIDELKHFKSIYLVIFVWNCQMYYRNMEFIYIMFDPFDKIERS